MALRHFHGEFLWDLKVSHEMSHAQVYTRVSGLLLMPSIDASLFPSVSQVKEPSNWKYQKDFVLRVQ